MSAVNFVHMDTGVFPVVIMQSFPENMAQTEQWVKELDALLDKQTPFALIYPPKDGPEKPDTQEDMDARKYVRRWLKTGKENGGILQCDDPDRQSGNRGQSGAGEIRADGRCSLRCAGVCC